MREADSLVVQRFPGHGDTIRALSRTSETFSALCHHYGETSRRLDGLERTRSPYTRVETEILRRRRSALADQILHLMERKRLI